MFWKFFQNLQENTCYEYFLLLKLKGIPPTLLKNVIAVVSCEFTRVFEKAFLLDHLLLTITIVQKQYSYMAKQGSFLGIRALGETFYLLLKKDIGAYGKIMGFRSYKLLKIAFEIRNSNHRGLQSDHFFFKIRTLFSNFPKRLFFSLYKYVTWYEPIQIKLM